MWGILSFGSEVVWSPASKRGPKVGVSSQSPLAVDIKGGSGLFTTYQNEMKNFKKAFEKETDLDAFCTLWSDKDYTYNVDELYLMNGNEQITWGDYLLVALETNRTQVLKIAKVVQKVRSNKDQIFENLCTMWLQSDGDEALFNDLTSWYKEFPVDVGALRPGKNTLWEEVSSQLPQGELDRLIKLAELVQKDRSDKETVFKILFKECLTNPEDFSASLSKWVHDNPVDIDTLLYDRSETYRTSIDTLAADHPLRKIFKTPVSGQPQDISPAGLVPSVSDIGAHSGSVPLASAVAQSPGSPRSFRVASHEQSDADSEDEDVNPAGEPLVPGVGPLPDPVPAPAVHQQQPPVINDPVKDH